MIEYTTENTTRTWYVIFDKRRGGAEFWHLFTRKNFDHVWLLTPLSQNILAIKPTPSECLIEEWPCTVDQALAYLSGSITAVLKFESKYSAFKPYIARGIISCVVMVKYILGVKGFCLTPLGLHNKLKKIGAEEYVK
jgi:hypothetical protein